MAREDLRRYVSALMTNRRIRQTRKPLRPVADIERRRTATLTSAAGMGGIIGAGGYDYQTRFIVCKVPFWLADPGFIQLFHEGTGDVDIRRRSGHSERRTHIQVKDHEVALSEFRDAIETFVSFDNEKPGVYDQFILVCPLLNPKLRPLEKALARVRDAKPFYDTKQAALDSERDAIRKTLDKLGLSLHPDFIQEKLHFQLEAAQFSDDDVTARLFVTGLQDLADYRLSLQSELLPAYAEFLRLVSSNRGKVVERRLMEHTIAASVRRSAGKENGAIHLDVHNWTRESFEPKADYELDWSNHFDRATRKIPGAELFGGVMLPELYALQKRIAAATSNRLIKFRGKCCLSTGLALGAAFPENGGWVFEVSQPQMPTPWRSNASPGVPYPIREEEVALDPTGDSVALVFSLTGDATIEVQECIQRSNLMVKSLVSVKPANGPGSRSILNANEAVSLALASRDCLKGVLLKNRVHTTHLFFYGPLALAIFVGQKLTSLGQVRIFEYTNPGYVLTLILNT